jgi:hypothetical protein
LVNPGFYLYSRTWETRLTITTMLAVIILHTITAQLVLRNPKVRLVLACILLVGTILLGDDGQET